MDMSTINCHEKEVYFLQFSNRSIMFKNCVFFLTALINLHKGVLLLIKNLDFCNV